MAEKKVSIKKTAKANSQVGKQHKAVAYACKRYRETHGELPDHIRWKFEDAITKKKLKQLLEKYEVIFDNQDFGKKTKTKKHRQINALIATTNSIKSIGTPM